MLSWLRYGGMTVYLGTILCSLAAGQLPADVEQAKSAAVQQALSYLRDRGQAADGTFSSRAGSGIT